VAATLVAAVLAGWAPSPALAAEPTFEGPVVTATFGVAIELEQSATLPQDVRRVEALVRTSGSERTLVAPVTVDGGGPTTLRYVFETELGALFPNTVVELGFRVTMDDGSVAEGPTASVRYTDTRFTWRTLVGERVRVHWTEGGDAFGRRVLDIGEEAVDRATALLGVEETSPIDFFVYADDRAFQEVLGPGSRENVGGVAPGGLRTLFASIGSTDLDDAWVGIVVPHELAHVVFETATQNPYNEAPTWLNEGLAVYLAEGYSFNRRSDVERAVANGTIMPLHALAGRFPTTVDRFGLAYGESVAAVDYMVRAHGQGALVDLVRSYAGGVTDDAAFQAALGVDVATFEAGWYGDLGIDAPQPYGPRPAPPGPVPLGWQGAAPTPGAASPGAASPGIVSPGPTPAGPGPVTPGTDSTLAGPLVAAGLVLLGAATILYLRRRAPATPAHRPESEP
jgi:hypothetical protein